MLLRIDGASSQPVNEQIADQIRGLIASGSVEPGEKLPPARQLADGLSVNVHTMLRAYQTLRDEGLLEIRRGRGTVVTERAPEVADVSALAQHLVEQARRVGLSRPQIIQLLEAHL